MSTASLIIGLSSIVLACALWALAMRALDRREDRWHGRDESEGAE